MTREGFEAVMQTVHVVSAEPDGDDWRTVCLCGYCGFAYATKRTAIAVGCAIEQARMESEQRKSDWQQRSAA